LFPKSERIVKTKQIQKALKAPFRGSCLFGQILLSHRQDNKNELNQFHGFRVMCIVSKKIHKKANQRNKIRRRLLAIFADLKTKKRLPPNIDCVIIVRNKDILTATFVEYQANIIPAVSNLYQKMSRKLFKNEQSKPVSSPNKI
jgi:ribonuclease P protein component